MDEPIIKAKTKGIPKEKIIGTRVISGISFPLVPCEECHVPIIPLDKVLRYLTKMNIEPRDLCDPCKEGNAKGNQPGSHAT